MASPGAGHSSHRRVAAIVFELVALAGRLGPEYVRAFRDRLAALEAQDLTPGPPAVTVRNLAARQRPRVHGLRRPRSAPVADSGVYTGLLLAFVELHPHPMNEQRLDLPDFQADERAACAPWLTVMDPDGHSRWSRSLLVALATSHRTEHLLLALADHTGYPAA